MTGVDESTDSSDEPLRVNSPSPELEEGLLPPLFNLGPITGLSSGNWTDVVPVVLGRLSTDPSSALGLSFCDLSRLMTPGAAGRFFLSLDPAPFFWLAGE